MTRLNKFKEYMSLCGITIKKDLKTLGDYHASEQYLGQVLNGTYPLTDKEERSLYNACNVARARKLMGSKIP